jgi:hypothetical protein
MLTRIIPAVLAGFVLLLPHQEANQTKTPYKSTGNEATLVGTVTIKGQTSKPLRIDTSADPICLANGNQAFTEYVVRHGDKLENVFIYFKSGEALRLLSFETPTAPVVLHRRNCRFAPRVIGVRVNQPFSIENNDLTYHNTHPTPKLNREWNKSQPPDSSLVEKFERAEFAIPIRCNQHPWEKAYVAVFDHPFFATSDAFGRYQISAIPAGRYQVIAWHEKLGEQETEITLVPGEVRNLDFVFAGDAK